MPQEPMPQEPIPQEPIPQEPIPQQPLPQDPAPQDEPAPKLPGEVIDPAIDATQQRPGEEVGGTLVSVSEDSIVVHDKTGLKHSFAVAGDAMITLDGEEAALADLGADVEVRVKIEHRDDTFVVTHIDATTPE
jgi:hypothetical protein